MFYSLRNTGHGPVSVSFLLFVSLAILAGPCAFAATPTGEFSWDDPCFGWKMELLRADASEGDPMAQFEIGRIAWDGICGPFDPEFAAGWLLKAAEAGHGGAGRLLGEIHFSGVSATGSKWMAHRFVEIAAAAGHLQAQQALGLSTLLRARTEDQRRQGMGWLETAAGQGSGFAAAALGLIHERGMHGAAIDRCLAVAWYRQADEGGFRDLTPGQRDLIANGAGECRPRWVSAGAGG